VEVEVVPDLKDFPNKLGTGLKSASGIASTVGRGLGLAVAAGTAVAAIGLKSVIELGNEYTSNLNELQAVTSATGFEMAKVGEVAKALGSDMSLPATSAADAAAAMKELAKGGLDVNEAMTAAKGTLQLAAAAQVDAAQAAEIQSDALNQFGLAASEAGHVADVLANTANAASGEITDMANALKYVGPVAKTIGVNIDNVATAIGLVATQGIRGEQAGTSLRGMLASLAAPSKPAAAALKDLGIQAFTAEGKFVGLRSVTEQLAAAKGRMTEAAFIEAAAVAFGNEGMTIASALASTGAVAFDKMAEAVGRSGGAAQVAAAKTQGLGGAWEGFVSQLETAGIEIYEAMDGPLERLVRASADHVANIGEGVARGLEIAIAAGEVYGPRLAEAIRSRASVVGDAAKDVLAPLASGALVLGNEALNTGLRAWDQFTDVLGDVVDGAKPAAEGIRALAVSAVDGDGAVSALAGGVGLLGDGIAAATNVLGPIGELIGGVASAAASLPGPLQAAVLGLIAYRVASSALGNSDALPAMRQFSGEMRVQAALASANGVGLSRMEAALAAYQTTQLPAVAAARSFTDTMAALRAEAASAGRPIGLVSSAIGVLVERTPALGAMRDTYRSTFEAISQGSEKAALSAGIAAESLGRNLSVAANRAALEVESAGQRLTGFGGSVRGAFDSARDTVTSRASAIVTAVQTIPTAVGVAAITTQDRIRGMVTSIGDSVAGLPGRIAVLPTAIGVGVIGAMDRIPGAVTGAVDALGRFGAVAGGVAAAGARGLASAASGLIGALGGPWGVVIAAAGVGLSMLAGRQQDAAKKAQQHASAVDGLAAALRESNGAINEQVRLSVAQRFLGDEFTQAAEAAKSLNVSMGDVTNAALDQGSALEGLRSRLQAIVAANMAVSEGDLMGGSGTAMEMNDTAKAAQKLLDAINTLAGDTQTAAAKNRDLDEAIRTGRASMLDASGTGRTLAAAMGVLSDKTSSADSKARALNDALVALSGGSVTLEAAQFRVAEVTDRLGDIFAANGSAAEKAAAQANGFGAALLNADGSLSAATENGRALRSALQDLTAASADVAKKTYDMAIAQGESVPDATAKAVAAVQLSRDAFVGMANDLGISATAAGVLADKAGLIPSNVAIVISTPGDDKTRQELTIIKGLVDAVPPGKEIHMQTISAEAEQKLIDLGFKVQHMPDGTVTISGNTQPAQSALDSFLRAPATKVVTVVYHDSRAGIGPMAVNHDGGVLKAFASGGFHGLRPMPGGIATRVPPNTWRVVGDRMDVPEAYIPINQSPRSQQILLQTARDMGYDLIKRFAVGGIATPTSSGAGPTSGRVPVEKHFHLTVQNAGNSTVDLRAQFARLELMSGM
jgi:TP901 family phage tail tape measure protein